MPSFDIITMGSAVRDTTLFTGKGKIIETPEDLTSQKLLAFEYGAKIHVDKAEVTLGGGGANTAVNLARLGYKVAAFVGVGDDQDGREVINAFDQNNVSLDYVQVKKKVKTGFSSILLSDKKEKDRIIFSYMGANEHIHLKQKDAKEMKAKWVYLASLCGHQCLDNLRNIFTLAHKKMSSIAWNPGSIQLRSGKKVLEPYLKATKILMLNKDEAIELVLSGIKMGRKNPRQLNKPVYLLNILHEWGPEVVVITNGKNGAWAYDGKKVYRQKIKRSKVVDTTGVGDAFNSTFLAGYIENNGDITAALKWASINAASVVTKVGAQNGLLTKKELIKKT